MAHIDQFPIGSSHKMALLQGFGLPAIKKSILSSHRVDFS